eukprot:gene1128-1290_t
MTPYPTHIAQAEVQLVKYNDNTYFASPYDTDNQKTTIKLFSSKVESHSELAPSSLKGSTVTYGPYKDIAPLSYNALSLHFENNAPFLMLAHLAKEIEISHWGNVAVESTYKLEHRGAAIKGPFSRLDYQRQAGASPSHVADIEERVPLGAADFYYRDYIGNISTSQYQTTATHTVLKIVPRFPLFGGWKNEFYTGFNVPSQAGMLFSDSDSGRYIVNATFGVGISNIWAETHEVRVILPEGAVDIEVRAPFAFVRGDEIRKTFLDTTGRPVVVMVAHYTADEHIQTFQVSYRLTPFATLHEPLLCIGTVFALCLIIMASTRIDMSLVRKGPKVARSQDADKLAQQFASVFDGRIQYHMELENVLNDFSRSGSVASFTQGKAILENKYKESSAIPKIIASISSIDPVYSARLKELNDLENQMTQIQNQMIDLETKQKSGKGSSKSEYEEIRNKLAVNYRKSYDDVMNCFDQVTA